MSPIFLMVPYAQLDLPTPLKLAEVPHQTDILTLTLAATHHIQSQLPLSPGQTVSDIGGLYVEPKPAGLEILFVPEGTDVEGAAQEFLKHGKVLEASHLLEFVLRSGSSDFHSLYNLGLCYNELGKFEEATIRLGKAIELDPKHSNAHIGLGLAYYKLRNLDRAGECMQQAVSLAPQSKQAHKSLAAILAEQGQHAKALVHWDRSLDSADGRIDIKAALGYAQSVAAMGSDATPQQMERGTELAKLVIDQAPYSNFSEMAKSATSQIVQSIMRRRGLGTAKIRPDVLSYLENALSHFDSIDDVTARNTVIELLQISERGVKINDPEVTYEPITMGTPMTGLKLMAYLYVGLKRFKPDADLGIDFAQEYRLALASQLTRPPLKQ